MCECDIWLFSSNILTVDITEHDYTNGVKIQEGKLDWILPLNLHCNSSLLTVPASKSSHCGTMVFKVPIKASFIAVL